jgi:quercetin dioxygenase-like cupin family protein
MLLLPMRRRATWIARAKRARRSDMAEARVVRASEGEVYGNSPLFKHGSLTGAPFDLLVVNLGYREGPPLHVHAEQYDTFYVLEGVVTVQIRDELIELMPGDFASVPPGVPHTFDNVREDQPAVKVLNIMTPGGLDAFFVKLKEQGAGPGDPAKFVAVAETCGMKMVGPPIPAAAAAKAAVKRA